MWFYGRVAETDVGRSKIEMKVKSLLNLLAQQQMPRRLYQAACTHVFGDPMCTFNRDRYVPVSEPCDALRPGHDHRDGRRQ